MDWNDRGINLLFRFIVHSRSLLLRFMVDLFVYYESASFSLDTSSGVELVELDKTMNFLNFITRLI